MNLEKKIKTHKKKNNHKTINCFWKADLTISIYKAFIFKVKYTF